MIRLPESLQGAERVRQVNEQVANIDLAPTILDLAEADPCGPDECRVMDGRSLVPLMQGRGNFPSDRSVVIELTQGKETVKPTLSCSYAGLRTTRGIYVEHTSVPRPSDRICQDSARGRALRLPLRPLRAREPRSRTRSSPPGSTCFANAPASPTATPSPHRVPTVSRALAATALVLTAALVAAPVASAKTERQDKLEELPNIVMVVTDDQTLAMLNERTMPETLARIGGEGTTFTDAVATTPLCCPSRAAMLTGQYGHNNGVLDNKYRLLNKKRNILPVWLERSGYTTIHVGRYLNGYERVAKARTRPAPGWSQWHSLIKPRRYYGYTLSVNGGTRPYTNAPEDYLTSVLTERSVQMINRFGPQSKPFYLQVDHLAPHTSGGEENGGRCVGAAIPGPQDEDAFDGEPLPGPALVQRGGRLRQAVVHPLAAADRRRIRSRRCAGATAVRSARCERWIAPSPRSTRRCGRSGRRSAPSSSSSPTTATTTASTGSRSRRTTPTPRPTACRS